MKKILGAILFSTSIFINAQTNLINQRGCGTGVLPQQFETWVQSLQQNQSQAKNGSGSQNVTKSVFNIPVIVHFIHNN